MNKNSKLNKIIITLCVIELILILFFLAYLLVYSLVVGGDSLIMSPTLYACVFFMLMIPIGMVFYYLALKNNKRNVYKFEREESENRGRQDRNHIVCYFSCLFVYWARVVVFV